MKLDPIKVDPKAVELTRVKAEEAVVEFLHNIPNQINSELRAAVLSYFGITKSFGRIELRKDSIVYSLISEKARAVIKKMVGGLTWEPTTEELEEIRKEALREYKRHLQSWINSHVRKIAAERVEKWKEELLDIEIELPMLTEPTVDELADPEYGESPLRKILMEAQLEKILKEESCDCDS